MVSASAEVSQAKLESNIERDLREAETSESAPSAQGSPRSHIFFVPASLGLTASLLLWIPFFFPIFGIQSSKREREADYEKERT